MNDDNNQLKQWWNKKYNKISLERSWKAAESRSLK